VAASDINAHVAGNFAGSGGLQDNQTKYHLILSGTAPMAFPGFRIAVPFTEDELVSQIEAEISSRISGDAQPEVVQFHSGAIPFARIER
jgi:hypothetical protein